MQVLSRISFFAASWWVLGCQPVAREDAVWVTIPHGASIKAVAESLAVHQLVTSPGSFEWYAKFSGATDSLRPGSYRLYVGMSPGEIVDELREGRPFVDSLVIPPGLWLNEIAGSVELQLGIRSDSFVVVAHDSALVTRMAARGHSLEGYLFPGVHRVRRGATAREVVYVMLEAFEAKWRTEWTLRLDSLGLSRDEIVTLASIVEGEGGVDTDAPYMASVYHNRLRRGMRLQADPTVVYGMGKRRRLYNGDYGFGSPYNTYRIEGLPPTPIGNPSAATLEAVLYPEETEFLYFVAAENGKHIFTRSYREHLDTIRSIRDRRSETRDR